MCNTKEKVKKVGTAKDQILARVRAASQNNEVKGKHATSKTITIKISKAPEYNHPSLILNDLVGKILQGTPVKDSNSPKEREKGILILSNTIKNHLSEEIIEKFNERFVGVAHIFIDQSCYFYI